MKFSFNFIKEFFEVPVSARELAERLTMSGLEIEKLTECDGDWIFDAEVTPNRYDWLSIFGIALEASCLCQEKLSVTFPQAQTTPLLNEKKIHIHNTDDCSLYVARLMRNVRVGSPPAWMRDRLKGCGVNSINNVVDATNYCMLKWGNPLHAFDLHKLEGDIHIRRAKKGESFLGLDGVKRTLGPENLVISDEKKVVALAGVIGAQNTQVDENTKDILLEAAVFSPLTVRRSRRAAALDTESSYRFERSVSEHLLGVASWEAAELIREHCYGEHGGYRLEGRRPAGNGKTISVSFAALEGYMGGTFDKDEVRKILRNLWFEEKQDNADTVTVQPPFFRQDIQSDVDVFEEIIRIYGYDRIEEALPLCEVSKLKDDVYEFKKSLRAFLVNAGLTEIVTYSLTSDTAQRMLGKNFLSLINPLRSQENTMRISLFTGMVETIRYNCNQSNTRLALFEIADVYTLREKAFREEPKLALSATGKRGGFYFLKGIISFLMRFLNVKEGAGYYFKEGARDNFKNALLLMHGEKTAGFLGKLDTRCARDAGIKEELCFAQLDIGILMKMRQAKTFTPFSRIPLMCRDISLALMPPVKFSQIEKVLKKNTASCLTEYKIIDVYKEAGKRESMFTLRIFYHSSTQTLTSAEVDSFHSSLRETLSRLKGVTLR